MTPEQILTNLRDIHHPAGLAESGAGGFSVWPLLLVFAVLFLILLATYRRRTTWRRQTRAALADIARTADRGDTQQAWQKLATLMRQLALMTDRGSPASARLHGTAWLEHLDHLTGTDWFSTGPGQGLAMHPYRAHENAGDPSSNRALMQLLGKLRETSQWLTRLSRGVTDAD